MSQLRKALGDGRLVTRERGYELVVAEASSTPTASTSSFGLRRGRRRAEAAARLREALACFAATRWPICSSSPGRRREIARLEERRLAALEARIDADLALGRSRELVPELEALVAAHPYREELLDQLVLALYRSGRQADALEAHRRGAARLRDELGLEPSRELQGLEQRILRQDPALDPPRAGWSRARRDGEAGSSFSQARLCWWPRPLQPSW